MDYKALEKAYEDAKFDSIAPNAYMTVGAYTAIVEYLEQLERDDFDEFTDWVTAVRQQPTAKQRFRGFIEARYPKHSNKKVYNGSKR